MTSTPFNVGLGDGVRRSSRVLLPPGGGHTDIFGGEPEPPVRNYRGHAPTAAERGERSEMNDVLQPEQNGHAVTPEKPQEAAPAPPVPEAKTENPAQPAEFAEPAPPAQLAQPAEQPQVAPPRRVRVPPGGFSSKLW